MDLSRRVLLWTLLAAAIAGTIGYVREHDGEPAYEASVSGQAREIGGLDSGRPMTERILAGSQIAAHLHDGGQLTAPVRELRRAVRVDFDWPRFTIRARGDSPGYAAVLARSWAAAVTPLLDRLLRTDPGRVVDMLGIPPARRGDAERALRRERMLARQSPAVALPAGDRLARELARSRAVVYRPVDVVAGVTAPAVPERPVNRAALRHLVAWLSAGALAGFAVALLLSVARLRLPAPPR